MERMNEKRPIDGANQTESCSWKGDVWVFTLFFSVATLIACFPILIHPTRHLAELPYGDKGTNLWNLWWVYYALIERQSSPLQCDLLFYPWGIDLRYHTLSLVNGLIAIPVTALLGPNVSFNLLFVLWTFLTGVFAAGWAREFRLSLPACCLVGIVAMFGAYRWSHQIHLNLYSTHWLFLSFWALERLLNSGSGRAGMLLAIGWICGFYSDWYYGLFIGIYVFWRFLFFLYHHHEPKRWLPISLWLSLVCVSIAILFRLYFINLNTQIPIDEVGIEYAVFWSLDLFHVFLPNWLIEFLGLSISQEREFQINPGLFLSILGFVAILFRKRVQEQVCCTTFLISTTFIFLLLSLGPALKVAERVVNFYGIPLFLPGGLLPFLPMLSTMRVFARFAYIGFICLTLLGLGLIDTIRNRDGGVTKKMSILVLLGIIFFMEIRWSFPHVYDFSLDRVQSSTLSGPVLELPFTPSRMSGLHLFRQTLHQQPIYVVEFSRLGAYRSNYLEAFPILKHLDTLNWRDNAPVANHACEPFMDLGAKRVIISTRILEQKNTVDILETMYPEGIEDASCSEIEIWVSDFKEFK